MAILLFTSCGKKDDATKDDSKNLSGCSGTDVAANTWAVIDADGKTTTVPMTTSDVYNSNTNDDRIEYVFYGKTSSLGDNISFTFKGENPPKTGTYILVGTDQNISTSNNVFSMGVGGGTAVMGGGLFAVSGNISVTNSNGAISIEGKGLNYKTALGKALCVSFKLVYNK